MNGPQHIFTKFTKENPNQHFSRSNDLIIMRDACSTSMC